jgi:hypothetical protein
VHVGAVEKFKVAHLDVKKSRLARLDASKSSGPGRVRDWCGR